jgi:polyisoprenoid-binding protein YceI
MTKTFGNRSLLITVAAAALSIVTGSNTVAQAPLAVNTARVTIAGTSNVHDYTASTSQAKVTRVQIGTATPGEMFWEEAQKPGGLAAFDITIPAETLKSTKDGLDKNMYKALKTKEHPEITFHLSRLEGAADALQATGTLRVAGVEREISFPVKTTRKGSMLGVSGVANVLMTDYGIAPPKAMMGMVKADPKIKVTFELVLAVATT